MSLTIRMLGELELRSGGEPLPPLESARAESLLAHLLLHRGTRVGRQRLAFLLWPDSSEPQARTNLRHVLHTLRHALPAADACLEVTARTLQWRADAPCTLDVAAFETALARGDDAGAVELYRGDLLAGAYDDWLYDERERLRRAYLEALERLAARAEADGRAGEAIGYAERLARADPLREDTCRRLIRLYDASGDRARAVRAYHACAAALERELGVAPSPSTRAAYEALLPGEEPAAEAPAAAFVGRAAERARLAEIWRDAAGGRAQLVLVTGEPGVGKTRLVEQLRNWCAQGGAVTAEARSYPAEGTLAYGPVAAWLRSPALAARRVRLDRGRLAELARLLPEISGLPRPEPLPEDERRQRLFDALAHALVAGAGPRLLVADDLHWADRETLRFLHHLLRSRSGAPLLVAATARREDMDALRELVTALAETERVSELALGPLSPRETAALAERLAGGPVDGDAAERLYAETEGNPLFVTETLRAGVTSPRLQAVITARLARLSPAARELAGLAATVGREFTADVLAHATGDPGLFRALDELWRRDIVRERGPDAYDFSHDKIREVAYRELEPAQRRQLHGRVARALEALRPGEPGPVALHHDRAGARDAAVEWYERAADAAQRMHASAEAARLLERALVLAAGGPRELPVLTALVPLAANTTGFGSPRVEELHERALALSGGEPSAPLLRSLALAALSRSRFSDARRHGEQMRERARAAHDEVLCVESDYVLGVAAFWQGQLAAARAHFEAAVAGYRPEHRTTHLVRYGLDPRVVCQSRLANTLAFLGEPDAARRTREAALAAAEETGHAASLHTALVFAALLALDLGDTDDLRRHVAALEQAAADPPVKAAAVAAQAFRGYLVVLDGDVAGGLRRVREALADRGHHAPGHRATIARILLAACVAAGDAEAAAAAADELLAAGAGAALWAAEARNAGGTPAPA